MQTDLHSIPGDEVARRLARLPHPGGQREVAAIERLKSWDRRLGPDTIAGTHLPGVPAALCAATSPGPPSATATSPSAGSTAPTAASSTHVTSPWRWHSHLLSLWEEADEELIGRPWDDLVAGALRGALDDLEHPLRPRSRGAGAGAASTSCASRTRSATPTRPSNGSSTARSSPAAAQETVCQVAYDPNDPYHAIWAPSWRMVADPADPERSMWQAFTGQSGHAVEPPLRRPPAALDGGADAADGGRGSRGTRSLSTPAAESRPAPMPSRRDQIKLTDEELAELLDEERVVVVSLVRPARLAALDAALVHGPRRRDLDLDLRQVPEGQEPRARPQGDPAGRNRRRVHRAARSDDRGRGRAHPRPRPHLRVRQGPDVRYSEGIDSIEGDAAEPR